jgi:hypothetical protein
MALQEHKMALAEKNSVASSKSPIGKRCSSQLVNLYNLVII